MGSRGPIEGKGRAYKDLRGSRDHGTGVLRSRKESYRGREGWYPR